ncbi:putative F-box protein At5g55150 [Solanum verrucosum]|uniref:putative F-box protein At5g55150 n=1 Tax=Solanum verrucosum TaxID=315347 RepID=UPI0020D02FD6|nr:putative F-box protein At5g55150 [Solanum verrucosum]
MAGGWADLSMDLLAMIANRIELPKDFIFFTCVCTSWKIATTLDHKFDIFFTQTPLLMLADKHDDYREFYSLIKQKVTPLFLPEARQRHCCPSEGWLCTMDDSTGEMNLLHHLSRTQIQLPSRDNLMASNGLGDEVLWDFMEKAIFSASPSVTSDYVLVVNYHADINRLAFWRPGDLNWTNIKMNNLGAVMGINYYRGKFYYVTARGEFWVFEVQPNAVEQHLLYWSQHDIFLQHSAQYYLVELSDKLLFITRFAHYPELHRYKTYKFKIFEVDAIKGELKEEDEIKTLGDSAIFLGFNTGTCSIDSSKFPGIKPNYIYFTDDWYDKFSYFDGAGRDMGAYNFEDGEVESIYPGSSLSHISPPTWIIPSQIM